MQHQAIKVRIYPTPGQEQLLAQAFGCSRWWWNFALNKSIETYKETGKAIGQVALNALLPKLKKQEETSWLADCYSQVLQATTLNLVTAYKNFFEGRARFPRFKSKKSKQSIQYPQNVKILANNTIKIRGGIGDVRAKIYRPIDGQLKTVTISKTPSGKYFASILVETLVDNPLVSTDGRVIGIDLGIKEFAVTHNGEKVSKYSNPKHLAKHEKNLKRKQQKLARKKEGSNSRLKAQKITANLYERVANARQDFLHKLSRKLVNENQVVVVENRPVKGIEDWTCPHCGTHHDRDGNAAANIRAEGIRMIETEGIAVSAVGGEVRPHSGRKSVLRHSPMSTEAPTVRTSFSGG
ncbi:MAG: transposase [Microcoleus sp. CSU_2_2]|nr:transposase [Microcoleus sp. SU_5_3]NJS12477.1 transposase [Microcoleus sp. CSU_2_2]